MLNKDANKNMKEFKFEELSEEEQKKYMSLKPPVRETSERTYIAGMKLKKGVSQRWQQTTESLLEI